MSERSEEASQRFPVSWRGYDRDRVEEFIAGLTSRLEELEEERRSLSTRLEDAGDPGQRSMEAEFETVSREVGRILRGAWEAAEGMRSRAEEEAARWRREAEAEAAALRREAQEDAEALRSAAWTTSQEMLDQVQDEAERQRKGAEREILTIRADAERESHRLMGDARRESEEQLRSARMEAERMLIEARTRHDDIVEAAHKEAQSAQERARALESRRKELMDELESARAAIQRLESDLQARREALRTPAPAITAGTVRIVPPKAQPAPGEEEEPEEVSWREGEESVRVVPAPPRHAAATAAAPVPIDADAMAAEVRRLRESPAEEMEVATPEPAEPVEQDEPAAEAPPARRRDEVASLFAVLRGEEEPEEEEDEEEEAPEQPPAPAAEEPEGEVAAEQPPEPAQEQAPPPPPRPARPATPPALVLGELDPFELRERLLLPVQNRVLRSVKRQLTEQQNVVLEELRVDSGWQPDPGSLEDRLHGDLVILAQESFAAGYAAAGEMTGAAVGRPRLDESDLPDRAAEIAAEVAGALRQAVADGVEAGWGPRELSTAVSRIFRAWRTDEAERRVRSAALLAFHLGLSRALTAVNGGRLTWVVSGKGCPECRAAAEAGPVSLGEPFYEQLSYPPAHAGCSCTLVPAHG